MIQSLCAQVLVFLSSFIWTTSNSSYLGWSPMDAMEQCQLQQSKTCQTSMPAWRQRITMTNPTITKNLIKRMSNELCFLWHLPKPRRNQIYFSYQNRPSMHRLPRSKPRKHHLQLPNCRLSSLFLIDLRILLYSKCWQKACERTLPSCTQPKWGLQNPWPVTKLDWHLSSSSLTSQGWWLMPQS